MFVIPILRELRQKNHESEDSLGYGERLHMGLKKWEEQLNKTTQKLNDYKAFLQPGS